MLYKIFATYCSNLGDIGHIIQQHAELHRYTVVREFGGHGIGQDMWEDSHVPHR